ncbi:MAG: protein-glutamate O-methyltransferase CheR [candidate division Zixibacteria bacterium]|nr:protein-glutamate O-methyltransferase CheR [candidate division Zixibacteria bacterium]
MVSTFDSEINMTPEEFRMIRDFIHEKSGMYFAENKTYLVKNRLQKRMAELDMKTVRDYFYHVKYDVSLKEFNRLMDLVTTNETSFFRNEPQLKSFSEEVLPLIVDEKQRGRGPKSLKIWSAGCSTGEEPYTLAIMILEKLKSVNGWNVEIIANDISEEVLAKARRGEYSGLTLRNVAPDVLRRYFTPAGDLYRVNPEIKALVKFSHLNLSDQRKISMMSNVDVVFCRNVMIYFSEEVKKQVVRGYYNALRPGGYFYIGHSETLHGISKAFKLVYFKNALVYQKENVTAEKTATAERTLATSRPVPTAQTATSADSGAARAMELLSKIKPINVKK